ncbi:MAG: CvpA family protein [Lachnospiraceae bacterium]|nr:CvpA family protein [Lachnospiraceae bacterium]
MNGLAIVVLIILLLWSANGYRKGLVKKLAGIVALAASWFLVSAALPYITDFLENKTPVYQIISEQCESAVNKKISEQILPSSQTADGQKAIDRDKVKELLNQYGMDSSIVDTLSDAELENYASQYFQDYMKEYQALVQADQSEENGGLSSSLTKIEQTELIKNLPLPGFLKETMLNYNNSEGYGKLKVTNFQGYIVQFFSKIILNIIAFILTLAVVQLVIWTGITALDIFSHLPVLNLINRLGGLALGAIQGVFLVWGIFLLISVFATTSTGAYLMQMINDSSMLTSLNESNLFLKIVAQSVSSFL